MKREQWFRPYFQMYYGRFALVVLLGILTVAAASALMFTSGYLISKSALRPENILMVYVPTVLVRAFGISRSVIHYGQRLIAHDVILRILSDMRVRLYRIVEPQALFIRSRFRTGDILGALADDIEYLQDVYMRTVFPSVIALGMYAVVIAVFGWFDLVFAGLMALYIGVLVFVLPGVSLWFMKRNNRRAKQEKNRLYQKLTDAVLGMSDWVISGRSAQFVDTYEEDEASLARVERTLSNWAKWRTFIGQLVVGLIVVAVIYWAGEQYADRQIDVTLIAAFVLVIFPLMDAFLPVSEAIERIPQYKDSVERLVRISETQGAEAADGGYASVGDAEIAAARDNAFIRVEQVRYRYEEASDWTLDGVSFDIAPGSKIAVIGRSGAGKSTLMKLLQGAVAPGGGSVTINGTPACAIGERMPRLISVLNQRPHLFDTTVANNIRLGRQDATDEEIRRVAEQVQLGALIESLPEGYDTPMHETGQRFSGGERQRIALARVLLQDNPIVIMDEPTVGLDPLTERELLQTIFRTLEGKTLIWITHHLVGVEQMNDIMFIENGRVEMHGTHAELMEQNPRYRGLYRLDRPFA
ncbi:thiol reductant ABC exporter subunit CydC [Paenibacillus marinisediminis]